MSKMGKIARRTFIVSSVAVTGGFVLGYWAYKKTPYNPLLDDLKPGESTLNPYIKIDSSGITIIAPRADLGQGIHSALAALVAEELEVSLANIKVEHGPASASYWNGVSFSEAFGLKADETGFKREAANTMGDFLGKIMGMQSTGGSSSIPDGFVKMRLAGAAGREMLLTAAATRWKVSRSNVTVKNGLVSGPDGQTATYLELAAEASQYDPPSDPPLKSSEQWNLVGKKMQRVDMVDKCTGQQRFGIDQNFPDMVYASVKTNPNLEKTYRSFNADKAKDLPGVIKVVPIKNGVAVIANNTWRAFKALNAIAFEWEDADYPKSTEQMFAQVQRCLLNEDYKDSRNMDEGNAKGSVKTSEEVVRAEYKVPFLAHAPLEPMSAVARYTTDKIEIWTANQIPKFLVEQVAKLTKLNSEQVKVEFLMAGGSFGRRLELDYVLQVVEIAMQHPEVPIKMTWSREEDMTHDPCRPLAMAAGMGVIKDSKVETFDLHVSSPSLVASQFGRLDFPVPGPDPTLTAGAWDQPFQIPNFRVTGYRTPPMNPISSWRSVGASINGFFFNSFFDELVLSAGIDPLEERIRLCNHEPSRKVLEEVGKMSNWSSRKLEKGRGRGLAFTLSFGAPVAEVIEVTQTENGMKVDKVFLAMEVGRVVDPVNFENQVQGGVIWGLGHAMFGEITFADGKIEQNNFHTYQNIRMNQVPEIQIKGLENGPRILGAGEPPVPPAAAALANAIFAATGTRIRELPMKNQILFA